MIVKIWPVKADYAKDPKKVGGIKGLKNAFRYITDDEKVIVKQENIHEMMLLKEEDFSPDFDITSDEMAENGYRVLNYMANEKKMEGKYISGYLCDPEVAIDEFINARQITLNKAGVRREKETGAVAFHLVQSFPEGLDISDEEVHQCGVELCQKIGAHQAVICSHVHPVVDEMDGELHGKCKHNHILINAYIHPDKWNPEQPGQLKYHDCKETYAQLRVWNDEIAIEHGLPIIRNPDDDRIYSWKETAAMNKGLSWKQRIRLDIENARRVSDNWDEFKRLLESQGYQVKDGRSHLSYTAPDGVHVARGKNLGREYTKENLEFYWEIRKYGYRSIETELQDNDSPPLSDLVLRAHNPLFAAMPVSRKAQGEQQYYYLPLERVQQGIDALETYFNADELYDVCDEFHRPIAAATGQEILECMTLLRDGRGKAEERKRRRQVEEEHRKHHRETHYYKYTIFLNSRTKRPYRTSLYDENGRRRGSLELLFVLALTVLKKEEGLWDVKDIPPGRENEAIFAPRNWKLQNMLDAIYEARERQIETPAELDKKLQESGAAYSRARSAVKKTVRAKEKMEPLNTAIKDYRAVQNVAEQILTMDDGPAKEKFLKTNEDVLQKYNQTKAVLYRYQVADDDQILDFERRYEKIQDDIKDLNDRLDLAKEDYRQLKKLRYNAELAQNAQYCYGPAYTYDSAYAKESVHESDEARNKRAARSVDDLVRLNYREDTDQSREVEGSLGKDSNK